jgi:rhamnulokinase
MNDTRATDQAEKPLPAASREGAVVAIDLGAESCRVSLLRFLDGNPRIDLVWRFPNSAEERDGALRWNIDSLWAQLQVGLRKCADIALEGIASIGVDGWAVDYVRLGKDGRPLSAPYCYRDTRTVAAEEWVRARISDAELFRLTGVQPLRINTLFQLVADNAAGVPVDAPWLNLPEYILFLLSDVRVAEYTNATHTQLVEVGTANWCAPLFRTLGLSLACAPPIVPSGSVLGPIQGALAELPAFANTQIIAPACHDTASAIAAIPEQGNDWAYISSGTWSLVGTLLPAPCASPAALSAKFTNLGAAGGGVCFHRNVNGMWLLRQCIETWKAAGRDWKIEELIAAARLVPPSPRRFDVDEASLMMPGDVLSRINLQLAAAGFEALPTDPTRAPEVASVLLQNLAARYAQVLEEIPVLTGKQINRICVVGGGSRNTLLNDFTEIACGIQVSTGFAECSTVGNFAIQRAALHPQAEPSAGVRSNAVAAQVQDLTRAQQTMIYP